MCHSALPLAQRQWEGALSTRRAAYTAKSPARSPDDGGVGWKSVVVVGKLARALAVVLEMLPEIVNGLEAATYLRCAATGGTG